MTKRHHPVLCAEAVQHLTSCGTSGNFVDATFGRGGHARQLLAALDPDARLLALDRDEDAFVCARALARQDPRVLPRHAAFSELGQVLNETRMAPVRGALMDLGVSSPQIDDPDRGFSFRADGPLDMRMDRRQPVSAANWLNHAPASELADVFRRYGEERHARRIARAVVAARPLHRTLELARVVAESQPARPRNKHPATRVFQAIRMFINDEPGQLESGMASLYDALAVEGRLAVISFHSLEDRQVKRFCRARSKPPPLPRHLPVRAREQEVSGRLIAGPVRAGAAEIAANKRARSATLRVLARATRQAAGPTP